MEGQASSEVTQQPQVYSLWQLAGQEGLVDQEGRPLSPVSDGRGWPAYK